MNVILFFVTLSFNENDQMTTSLINFYLLSRLKIFLDGSLSLDFSTEIFVIYSNMLISKDI